MLGAHAAYCCRGAGVPQRVQRCKPIIRFLSLQHVKQDAWLFFACARQLVGRCRPLSDHQDRSPAMVHLFFFVVVRSAITNSSISIMYSYCMVMFGCIKEAPPQGARAHNAAVLRSVCAGEALYEALLVLLTDWWWGPNLVHHCHGCCRDRRDTVRKIVDVLSLTIFNQTPPTPIPSRWSKVTVTVIWFYKGFAVHNILSKVFDWCFNPHGQRTVRGGLVVSEQALGFNVISHSGVPCFFVSRRWYWRRQLEPKLQPSLQMMLTLMQARQYTSCFILCGMY